MWRGEHVGELVKNATQTVLVVPVSVAAREEKFQVVVCKTL
jgi:hypothetical protein